MKILFIRHGDPDYEHDSLTEKGDVEAKLLAKRIASLKIDEIYQSPLGRAKRTASYSLEAMGREAVTLDWLREFPGTSVRPDVGKETLAWDWLPQDWCEEERFYSLNTWTEPEAMYSGSAKEVYDKVIESFDRFLADHGYEREGKTYRAVRPNNDTIAVFCHFGLTCVLLSRLLNVSPMILWHGFIAAPTSVTTVVTEERREGIASFRVTGFGDVSHLYAEGEEPAFAGRFRECYTNENERRD